jgi:hypothetical protein
VPSPGTRRGFATFKLRHYPLLGFHFLPEFIEEMSQLRFGGVDCPLPIDYAIKFFRIERQAVITGVKVAAVKVVVGGEHSARVATRLAGDCSVLLIFERDSPGQ